MGNNGSDKGSYLTKYIHNYTLFYHSLFNKLRNEKMRLFELGLGSVNPKIKSNMCFMRQVGFNYTPGASLRGWKEYFPNSLIFGADIDKDILFRDDRIKTYFCDQTSPYEIKRLWNNPELKENFDIIIDDGLHTVQSNICFFENSHHKVKKGGYYIIEDVHNQSLPMVEFLLKNWEQKYPSYNFRIVRLYSDVNKSDNNLIVIRIH